MEGRASALLSVGNRSLSNTQGHTLSPPQERSCSSDRGHMSDVGPPGAPASRWALALSCVREARTGMEEMPASKCPFLLQNQPQTIHPQVMGREEWCSLSPSPFLLTPKEICRSPGGHAPRSPSSPACGPRCSGSSCCSPHCPGSSHGRGQRSQGGLPGCRRRRRSSALPCEEEEVCHCSEETVRCECLHHRGCRVGFSRAQVSLGLTEN